MTPQYTTVMIDPPWPWDDRLRMQPTKRGSEDQYGAMSIQEIKDLYTPSRVEHEPRLGGLAGKPRDIVIPGRLCKQFELPETGFLCCWTTATHLLNGNAQDVCRHYGYEPKQIVPWVKARIEAIPSRDGCHTLPDAGLVYDMLGMGWITRTMVEYLIIATRGRYTSLVKVKNEPGFILAPEDALIVAMRPPKRQGTTHSRKPAIVYDKIERVMPGPYLDLFPSDDVRDGWVRWGRPRPEIVHPDTPIEWP